MTGEAEEKPIRDRPLDGWRVAATEKARALVREVTAAVELAEQRERKRTSAAQAAFERMIEAIVCDVVCLSLVDGRKRLAVPRDNSALCGADMPIQYRSPAHRSTLPPLLDVLQSLALIRQTVGWHDLVKREDREQARQTTISAGPMLKAMMRRQAITFADLGRDLDEPLVLLKGVKPKRGEEAPPHVEPCASLVAYDDTTPAARRLIEEVRTINRWLAGAEIALLETHPREIAIDTTERRLRRHFTRHSFESGGRLFGAFWLTMRRGLRCRLMISREPVVVLDYRAAFVALAYARAGAKLPPGDPYAVPGLEAWREGVKALITSSLFRDEPMTKRPRDTARLLPKGAKVAELMARIIAHHAPIASMFNTQVGHGLMFDESEVLIDVLSRLRALNVVGLPLHDAVIAPTSARAIVKREMLEAFRARTGGEVEVVG